jgi:hypothetical protein
MINYWKKYLSSYKESLMMIASDKATVKKMKHDMKNANNEEFGSSKSMNRILRI